MPRNTSGLLKGGPGRPKGSTNKSTKEIKAISTRLINDPAYVESLKVRLRRGTAGAVEPLLFHYAYGKPKDTTEVTGADGVPLVISWIKHRA
jgi:hypothetical protein